MLKKELYKKNLQNLQAIQGHCPCDFEPSTRGLNNFCSPDGEFKCANNVCPCRQKNGAMSILKIMRKEFWSK